jgi:cytochrome b561
MEIMMFKNSLDRYGLITKILHASIGCLIIYLLYLGFTMTGLENSPEKWATYGLHKSLGVVVLVLASLFYIWKFFNKNPKEVGHLNGFQKALSKIVKFGLLVIMLFYPLTGYIMSSAGGHAIKLFDKWEVPLLIEKGATIAGYEVGGIAHSLHGYLMYATIGLLVLHIAGALFHHFIMKDDTLKRMTTKF